MNARLVALPLLVASAAWIPSHAAAQFPLGNLIVTVSAPQAGATVGGTVPFAASVTIVGGLTVQSVEFRVNGVPIGTDTTAPYSIPWDTRTAGNGSRQLTARARDLLGLTFDSSPVTVTVFNDLTPPTVALTAPAAGASVSGSVAVAATASDNVAVAGVRFTLDGNPLGAEDTGTPYGVTWNTATASDGAHTLAAIARDAAGNVTTATAVTVTVDNLPPSVAITTPAANATLGGAITIAATASDSSGIAGVQFRIDGAVLGAEDTSAPYSAVWNSAAVSDGPHSITAVARDNAGKTTVSVAVSVGVDNTPPAVAITAPAGGTTVGGSLTISANASDSSGIAGVQFRIDGAVLGAEDTSAPYSAVWNSAAVSDGSHSITVVARDNAGKTTVSVAVSVGVDNTPPAVAITAPAGGTTVGGSLTISANASDSSGIAGVQFRIDGGVLGAEDTSAPYSAVWNSAAVSDGPHSITAVARDSAGKTTVSAAVAVSVDNTPPAVAITAPTGGATVGGTINIFADASDSSGIAGVQFVIDGAPLGAEDTSAPYSVPWNSTTAGDGLHSITAVARDNAGKTTVSAAVSVGVDNTPPAVAISAPAGGTTVSGSITISADASDGGGIAGVQFLVDGVNLGTEDTTAPYSVSWDTTAAANGSHTVAAIARDASGRTTTSGAVSVTVSNVTGGTLVRVEDNSTSIAYTGSWALGNTAKAWSAGTAALATGGPAATGEPTRATLTFTGTAVKWIGFKGPQTGIGRVYLNGTLVATVDSYAAAEVLEAVLYEVSGLPAATHTLVIESTGTKNPASSDIFVVVDAFDVTTATATQPPADPPPASTATRYEDVDADVLYTPGSAATAPPNWWHGSRSRGWSGETSSFNRSEGARATFIFTGTSVTWIGFRANWAGIARVFVDSAFVTELDLYSPTEQPQAPVFTASGLTAGTHAITIEATGRKNASATDNAVVVDAFDVSPAQAPRIVGARIEESAPAVTLAGGWTAARANQWSGGAASTSSIVGARATVTFTGNSVSLVGLRGPGNGIARVYLDGAFHATVDTYAPADIQAVIFTETNLAQGTHEVTIEVTGLKNAAASDHRIVVDAFDVRTLLEEVDPSVAYSGSWSSQNFDEKWSGTSPNYGSGSATRSATAGARAELSFVGTGVRWLGFRGPTAGIARVYVDGVFAAEVDAYSANKQVQTQMFAVSGLAAAAHTIAIEVTGLRNVSASNAFIVVDAFDVTLPASMPSVSRASQSDASYPVGPWEQSSPNPLFTGTTIAHSSTAGARAEFTFTGTGIRWIGQRGFANGIARVYLDGVHVGDVDSFAPIQEEYQAAMFSVSNLAAGSHTLVIEVLGTRNPAATGTRVVVDGFEIIR